MKKKDETINTQWNNNPEYRKQTIRELEKKYNLNIPPEEFGNLVY